MTNGKHGDITEMNDLTAIALQDLIEEVTGICEDVYDHCFELLSRLVACQSLSGQESECAEVLLTFFQHRRIPCYRDSRGSVLAIALPKPINDDEAPTDAKSGREWLRLKLAQARAQGFNILAFNAHMDVVSADDQQNWTDNPFKAVRRDGRIYGRGTCDMKGALAAMAVAMGSFGNLDRKYKRQTVVLGCFCTEEEVGEGLAFKELCEEFALCPQMVLLGEPSKMQIARGQRGKLECLVETTGVCAHTSVPEAGDNAAYKMARVLLAVEKLDEAERCRHGLASENMLQRTTVVATSVCSWPLSKSFVPDRSQMYLTARLALGETLATITGKLQADEFWPAAKIIPVVYQGTSYTGKASNWKAEHPAWETSKDHDFFKILASAYEAMFAEKPLDKIWPFSTDGVYSAGMAGIPTLGIGPGHEEMAHKVDEWVDECELQNALKLYTLLPYFMDFSATTEA